MNFNSCDLCFQSEKNSFSKHDNCKFRFLDLVKETFKSCISELQSEIKLLKRETTLLKEENNHLKSENVNLKIDLSNRDHGKTLDNESSNVLDNSSLNKATYLDSEDILQTDSEDTRIEPGQKCMTPEKPKSNKGLLKLQFNKVATDSDIDSSPEIKRSRFSEIPRRKSSSSSTGKWISVDRTVKMEPNGGVGGLSFIQSLNKKPRSSPLAEKSMNTRNVNDKENEESPSKSKKFLTRISFQKPESKKKLFQTKLAFDKQPSTVVVKQENVSKITNEQEGNANDETFCEDVIDPTPLNSISSRSFRSYVNQKKDLSNVSPTKKNVTVNETEESVICLPDKDDDVFCISDASEFNEFDTDSNQSEDLLHFHLPVRNPKKLEMTRTTTATTTLKSPRHSNEKQQERVKLTDQEMEITSPIRKKADKKRQPGFDCPECEQYYKIMGAGMSDEQLQKRLNECSKHRKNVRLHETPENYWNPQFTPTQEKLHNTIVDPTLFRRNKK